MAHVVILGGGFGGLTATQELEKRLGREHQITLIEQRTSFVMGLSHVWALDGRRPLEAGTRPMAGLKADGVEVVRATVDRIDARAKHVVAGGRTIPFDHLILALGAELAPELTPGFEAAHNLYDPAAVPGLAEALQSFSRGRILIAVAAVPFKCPPAPYEAAMLIATLLERRGVRQSVEIELTTPEPRPLPIASPSCSGDLLLHLKSQGILYAPDHKIERVDPGRHQVAYGNGERKPYDLLIGVPVHRAPPVLRDAQLTDASGWVPVEPPRLRTPWPGIWAVGDCTLVKTPSGKPLPKAGVFAEAQARVVAENVASSIAGSPSAREFDGRGQCFIELGDGMATTVEGEFFATPEPRVALRMPTNAALRDKERFESERLQAWFGH